MLAVKSTAAPMMITFAGFPEADVTDTAATAATTSASTPATPHLLAPLMNDPPLVRLSLQHWSCRGESCKQGVTAAGRQLAGRQVPERVRVVLAEGAVVGKDLEVVEAVPADTLERRQERREICRALAGQCAVAPAEGRPAPVGHVDTDDPAAVTLDLTFDVRCVPQVPRVEGEANPVGADLVDQRRSLVERGHHRPVVTEVRARRF